MPDEFQYDVFLSHSAKDKAVVRPLAERLRQDGQQGKAEGRMQKAEILHSSFCILPFLRDWAQLEAGTFRFRDPLNQERRFIPLRLDDAPIKGSLAQFLYINWCPADHSVMLAGAVDRAKKDLAVTDDATTISVE